MHAGENSAGKNEERMAEEKRGAAERRSRKGSAEVVNVISIPPQLFGTDSFLRLRFPTKLSPRREILETGRQVDGNLLLPAIPILGIGGLVIVCPYLDLPPQPHTSR